MSGNEKKKGEPAKARLLLVDDDQIVLDSLGGFLELEGYDVTKAETIPQAIDCLKAGRFNLVITDVSMPSTDGFELLRYVRDHHEDVVVIMVTGYGTIESAVEAIKQGAYDYLTKPIIDDDVLMAVRRALQQQQLLAENRELKRALSDRYSFSNIIGADFRMAKVFDLVDAVADSRTTALITGESGTGKSLVARAIHSRSPRRDGPFVEVACGALPETLLESELFGHVRGAFTDAVSDKPGKFAAADSGTIFLDEISTASPQLQVKLLRVLQERRFEPVGSNATREVDVRVILATNHDLAAEVKAGRFREDLYYRINVVNIPLPPLRERIGDIPMLAEHFLNVYLDGSPKRIEGFTPEAVELMQRYDWPGNVRELENCVERAVVLCREAFVGPDDLPPAVLHGAAHAEEFLPADAAMTLGEALARPEKQIIINALNRNDGNRQATAAELGINRTTLYKKMKKHGLMG
jgi:DNA-binding NtrC family response regulator